MENQVNPTATAEQNTSFEKVTNGNNVQLPSIQYPILTGVKEQKYAVFNAYYGDQTEEFVMKCTGRSPNSWKQVSSRIHDLEVATEEQSLVTERIYEDFDLNHQYTAVEIVKCICQILRDLKLPISHHDTKWFIDEVTKRFLIEKITDDAVGYTKVIGYKFLFRLKPIS
jgi:hypothetical protein